MKKSRTLIVLALVILSFISCNKKDEDVNSQSSFPETFFENDWAGAQSSAQTQNRKIFVDFYATWCTVCSNFKTQTLGNQGVRDYIEDNYVAVALDGEAEGQDMYNEVGTGSFPVLAIYENDGTLVTYHRGSMDSLKLVTWLEEHK